jgi:hypothetical protein
MKIMNLEDMTVHSKHHFCELSAFETHFSSDDLNGRWNVDPTKQVEVPGGNSLFQIDMSLTPKENSSASRSRGGVREPEDPQLGFRSSPIAEAPSAIPGLASVFP